MPDSTFSAEQQAYLREQREAAAQAVRVDLVAEVSRLRAALAWYADAANYDAIERHTESVPLRYVGRNIVAGGMGPIFWTSSNVQEDRGEQARAALEESGT